MALVAVKLKLLLLANALLRQNRPWTPAVSRTATPPAAAGTEAGLAASHSAFAGPTAK